MAAGGTVYLRTNKFKVKLEGITFKARDFESICTPADFPLKHQPVIGIDVMLHPRDPSTVLLLLCFGVGCMIVKFNSGEILPKPMFKFLTDERIRFVGFGVPEKKDLFPFEGLGLMKTRVDIGFMAAKILDDPKYKNFELGELARRVLGVSKMEGLSADPSMEIMHEEIKCAICQLFMSTLIAMTLLHAGLKIKNAGRSCSMKTKRLLDSAKMVSCLNETWCNLRQDKRNRQHFEGGMDIRVSFGDYDHVKTLKSMKEKEIFPLRIEKNDVKDGVCSKKGGSCGVKTDGGSKKPLKGILKCSSARLENYNPNYGNSKRANSKGFNVTFKP